MNTYNMESARPASRRDEDEGISLLEVIRVLGAHRKLLLAGPVVIGAAALGATYLVTPTFTAQTVFLPPQQQAQSQAASAMASLGALAGLAGGAVKTPGDQYVSLMQSANVEDRIVDRFKLMDVYQAKYRFAARRTLEKNTRVTLGKKDGLITLEVDSDDPKLAADIANQYVAELRRLTGSLALTEAQQRRAFFESEVKQARTRLEDAQRVLQAGGFSAGALKAEPRAAAESFARIKAELTSAEVRLQTMRRSMADTSNEVQQQQSMVSALRGQLALLEEKTERGSDSDYLGRYREFKYQETLFELFSKQYEMARVDESREGASVQVIDPATTPEYKSGPKRAVTTLGAALLSAVLLTLGVLVRHFWRQAREAEKVRASTRVG